jgi:hypothetical protein
LVVVLAAWLATGIEPSFSWSSLMDLLQVRNREAYTRLAILGLLVVAIVAIAKILREKRRS